MPFLVPEKLPQHKPTIIAIRSIAPKSGATSVVWKLASEYKQNNKKILIFDEFLGLPNTPYKNRNEQLIPSVLNGQNSLNQLIDTAQGIDFIAGQSTTNIHTLSEQEQNHIRTQLLFLIQSYDYVLLDVPSQCTETILSPDETFWVCLPAKKHIFNAIQRSNLPAKIILNKVQSDTNVADLNLYLKQLSDKAQLYRQFSVS